MINPIDKNIYAPYIRLVDYAIDRIKDESDTVTLLDAGCGHSTVLTEQYKKCDEVIGVDSDRIALNKNRNLDRKIFSSLSDIPLRESSVDIITSAWVFEHISEPETVIKEFSRLLKPNGYIIFLTPNASSWYSFISRIIPFILHETIVRSLFEREEGDTYRTYYKMNREDKLDKLFEKCGSNYLKVQFIYNDDPKYLGFNKVLRPISSLWHKIVMKESMMKLRVHLIGLYKKLP